MKSPLRKQARRGAIVPLAALLMVALVGMVAFAVDVGWMTVTQSELQNTADAAALAGVSPLMDAYILYTLPGQTQKDTILNNALVSARAKAKQYAQYNAAGGVSALTLQDSDVEFGFLDANNKYTAMPAYSGFPNTIKVTMRRDGKANGSLNLFFARALGASKADLTATASATMYAGNINSFSISQMSAGILPVTYDVNHWNNFVKTGRDPDGIISVAADGNPELRIYPSLKAPGNFGELSLDDSHTGASTTTGWINNGVSASDVQALTNNGVIPLASHDPTLWDWQGNTGFKASNVMTVNNHEGQVYLLPLFTPKNGDPLKYQAGVGQGSNYFYNIVQFVGIRIMRTDSGNREIIVQPAAVIEPNAIFNPGSIVPVGTTSATVTTFTTPKLSR